MKGILVIAHGSRADSTKRTLEQVVDMAKQQIGDMPVQIAYMEFAEPGIHDGLKLLMEQGCSEIAAAPYFLFDGIHIKEDIPEEISLFTQQNSHIKITMGKSLGVDKRLADVLVDRIRESV